MNEEKIKSLLFAQYMGQELAVIGVPERINYPNYPFDLGEAGLFLSGLIGSQIIVRRVAEDVKDRFNQTALLLRDVRQLSDAEVMAIGNHIGWGISEENKDKVLPMVRNDLKTNAHKYGIYKDIFRCYGVATDFTYLNSNNQPETMSVEEQIKRGFIKIKEA